MATAYLIPHAVLAATPVDEPPAETDATTTPSKKKAGYHTDHFRIRPSVSVTQQYETNVFATDTDTLSDWITLVSPRIKVDSTWAEHSLRFNAGADAGRYLDYDAENYLDYWANAEGSYALNGSSEIFGGIGFSFEHEGRDSPDANIAGPNPTTYRTLSAHAGSKISINDVTYRLGGTYEALDFQNVGSGATALVNDDRDRELFGLGLRATRELDDMNSVFVQALYDKRAYDLEQDQNGFRRDSDGYRAAVGLKSDLGGGNKAEGYIGIMGQSYDDSRFDDVQKVDFGGRLTLAPGKSTKLTARLQRSLNETTLAGSPGYLSTSLSGRLEHRVTPRLTPHLSFRYAIADYLQTGREDDTYSVEAGIKYFVARNAYILTGVRHTARDSNDVGLASGSNDFDRSTVFLTFATQGYPLFEPMISDFDTDGELEIGALYVSDDATRFGRYTGLGESGAEWVGNLTLKSSDGQRGYARIKGLDLGLDSRELEINWGSQGSYDAYVDYRQIPFNDFVGKTIFEDVGNNSLALPAGWVDGDSTADMTEIASNLSEVEIGTMRKRLGVGTSIYSVDNNWTVTLGYQTETKQGIEQRAGVIGNSPGTARAAMLPTPVDYTTNTLKASLGYLSGGTQLNLAYESSFFYNNLEALFWENPFDDTGPRGTAGAIALPPDNQFHQLSLSGGRNLGKKSRLTGVLSVGAMLQDQKFQPDTVNPVLTPQPLPRDSLEGEVLVYNGLLALSSRPVRGLNLKASYRLQRRDNNTPQDTFTTFVNDSFGVATNSPDTNTNKPYSYDKRTMRLDAGYRFNRMARLSGELQRETVKRSPSEVEKTTEDSGKLKLRLKPLDNVQIALRGGAASREGSNYEPVSGENPLLRKYHISDRDRLSAGIDLSYQPTNRLSLGANIDFSDDDYDATRVGLNEASHAGVTIDAAYQLGQDLSAHAYLGRERYESSQTGSQDPTDPPDWYVDNEDTVDSLGVGFRWQKDSRLEFGADYVMSRSTGETRMRSSNALPPLSQFPDLKSRLHTLELHANYKLRKNTRIKFSYQYEQFDADDWSTDKLGVDSIPEVLFLDGDNPSYSQHVVGISLISRF